jgi:GSH-dependent disulfide-bond oxidoreductase
VPVDTFKGEQHGAPFRAVNPNGKTPALIDGPTTMFDSTAILLYLAEKHGKYLGAVQDRGQLLSWLMFVASGLGPFSGQAVHFRRMAPQPQDYAVNRYRRELMRHYQVLEDHLAGKDYVVGGVFTIADISAWGWVARAEFALGEGALQPYPNLQAWMARIVARPALALAKEKGANLPLKRDFDEETMRALFPQNYPLEAGSAAAS